MELQELYRDLILDHNRQPRNFGRLSKPARHAQGHNPLCGDQLTVFVRLDGERVADILKATGALLDEKHGNLPVALRQFTNELDGLLG